LAAAKVHYPRHSAELTRYPFELKAAANASSAFQAKVIVKGKLKAIPAEGAFLLTVVAAPSTPKDSVPPEIIAKKTTPTPEPKKDPEKEKPKVIVKAKEKEKEPEKPKLPPAVVKTEPPELDPRTDAPLFLQSGDRKTTWVQIETQEFAPVPSISKSPACHSPEASPGASAA